MVQMIVIGADTHKVSHTLAAVQEATGRVLAEQTVKAKRRSLDDLLLWGARPRPGPRVGDRGLSACVRRVGALFARAWGARDAGPAEVDGRRAQVRSRAWQV